MKKVFISSVMREYAEMRAAARQAVEGVNCQPVMAEQFGAQPKSPQAAYLAGVRESEIYVGILGRRYSTPTEEEFDEAVRTGKSILIFVERTDREADQAVFLERVEDRILGYNRAAFSTEDELKLAVTQALARILTDVAPDYDASDRRLSEVPGLIAERVTDRFGSDSWLWLGVSPATREPSFSATEIRAAATSEALVENAFERGYRLFERCFATSVDMRGNQLEAQQVVTGIHGSPSVRFLLLDRFGTIVFGVMVSERTNGGNDLLQRLYYLDPEKVAEYARRFFLYSHALYTQLDPTHRIAAFSLSAFLTGTNRHFETPPAQPISSVTVPSTVSGEDELLTVPVPPFRIRAHQLRDVDRAEEIRELFKLEFDKRRPGRW